MALMCFTFSSVNCICQMAKVIPNEAKLIPLLRKMELLANKIAREGNGIDVRSVFVKSEIILNIVLEDNDEKEPQKQSSSS